MPLLDPAFLLTVLLVFARISGLFVTAPVFSQRGVPVQIRVLLAVLLAYTLAGLVRGPLPPNVTQPFGFMAAIGIEAVTGLVLGFAAQFIFLTVQFAGEIMGFQMGLGIAKVYNPINGEPSNPLGRILSTAFLLVFLLLDGHHHILRALTTSFEVVPLAGARVEAGGPLLLDWTGMFFSTALRLAAPFMVTLFLIDVSLGIFARVVPQADLFSLSLPLKLAVGLGLAYVFMQNFFPVIPTMVDQMLHDVLDLIEAMASI